MQAILLVMIDNFTVHSIRNSLTEGMKICNTNIYIADHVLKSQVSEEQGFDSPYPYSLWRSFHTRGMPRMG